MNYTEHQIKEAASQLNKQLARRLEKLGGITEPTGFYDDQDMFSVLDVTDSLLLSSILDTRDPYADRPYAHMLATHSIYIDKDGMRVETPVSFRKSRCMRTDDVDKHVKETLFEQNSCIVSSIHGHDGKAPSTHIHYKCGVSPEAIRDAVELIHRTAVFNRNAAGNLCKQ